MQEETLKYFVSVSLLESPERESRSLYLIHFKWDFHTPPPPSPPPPFFSFGQAANFILNFLNADARSVLRKWCIYSVSASCAGRNRDMQLMSLPRKLGGRVLECFSRERRDSSESVMTPGRGWCLCACQENWCEQRRKEEWATQGSQCLTGGRVHKCETCFFCLHFKCCRCSFPGIRCWEKEQCVKPSALLRIVIIIIIIII